MSVEKPHPSNFSSNVRSVEAVSVSALEVRRTVGRKTEVGENFLRRMVENATDTFFRVSLPAGNFEYINSAAIRMFGHDPEKFYRKPHLIHEVVHPDWHGYFEREWEKVIDGDASPVLEYPIIHKSGEIRWFYQRNFLFRDELGHPAALEAIARDITDRKQAAEERERVIRSLRDALLRAQELRGLVRMCCACSKIRDDNGQWTRLEIYMEQNAHIQFTHGICPQSFRKLYPQFCQDPPGSFFTK